MVGEAGHAMNVGMKTFGAVVCSGPKYGPGRLWQGDVVDWSPAQPMLVERFVPYLVTLHQLSSASWPLRIFGRQG